MGWVVAVMVHGVCSGCGLQWRRGWTCSCGWSLDRSGAREVGAVLIWEGAVLVVGVSGQSDEGVVALDTVSGG